MTSPVPDRLPRRRPVHALHDRIGGYLTAAICCFALTGFGVLVVIQSPDDMLLWTGTRVAATEQSGVVEYSWTDHPPGQPATPRNYSFPVRGNANRAHLTVYLRPSHPDHAVTNSIVTRMIDGFYTVLPFVIGLGLLAVGEVRSRVRDRRALTQEYGGGLDPEVVARILKERRRI